MSISRRPADGRDPPRAPEDAVLHARTGLAGFDEPGRKRHRVRLWLTAHGDPADGDAAEDVRRATWRKT